MWSVAAAIPASLLFEQPMLTLEKFLLPTRRRENFVKKNIEKADHEQ